MLRLGVVLLLSLVALAVGLPLYTNGESIVGLWLALGGLIVAFVAYNLYYR